jgi:hypothetical protein
VAVISKNYGPAVKSAFNKEIDFDSDSIKCSLHLVGYTPDQDHQYFSSATSEASGTAYTAGGVVLSTGKTVVYTAASNLFTLDADDAVWATSTIPAVRTAVVYDFQTAVAATAPLLAYFQSDTDISTTGATFTVGFALAGISTYTAT